jgi:hypothetical protein
MWTTDTRRATDPPNGQHNPRRWIRGVLSPADEVGPVVDLPGHAGSEVAGVLAGAPPRQRFSGARASLAGRRGRPRSESTGPLRLRPPWRESTGAAHGRDRSNVQGLPHGCGQAQYAGPHRICPRNGVAARGMARADPQVARRSSSRGQRSSSPSAVSSRVGVPRAPAAQSIYQARAVRRSPPGLFIRRTDSPATDRRQAATVEAFAEMLNAPPPAGTTPKKRGVGAVCCDRSHPPCLGFVCRR